MFTYVLHYLVEGEQEWKSLPLQPGTFSIGRMPGNELVIPDPRISRYHARLQFADPAQGNAFIWVVDQGAGSGVWIGQQHTLPNRWAALPFGEVATLGPLRLCVHAIPVQPAAAPPSPRLGASPEGRGNSPGARANPPSPVISSRPAARNLDPSPSPPARRSRRWLWVSAAAVLLCLCVVTAGIGAWQLYPRLAKGDLPAITDILPGESTAGTTSQPPDEKTLAETPPIVQSTHTFAASAGTFSDEHGARLSLPPESVPAEESLIIQTASLSQPMQDELAQTYRIDSLAYSIAATALDGAGRPTLQLPAPSPESRLAVLVDDQYLAILPGAPENGLLSVTPFLGAPTAADGYPTLATATQPNRYFVVTPKEAASAPDSRIYLASHHNQPDVTSCIPSIWHGNRCRTNQAGSVYVLYWNTEMPSALGAGDALKAEETIDGLIRNIIQVMSAYQAAGFTHAAISRNNPVYLIISAKESEPNYSQKTGNIYLGWSVIGALSGGDGRCTLAHELFHWIEDENYVMNAAALVNAQAWWLEMAAENGSFLIDPGCISHNIRTYGVATVGDQLAWQATPWHWDWNEGSRYVQALQMYISICDNNVNCALSPAEFARLVNTGTYPSSSVRDAYNRNATDAAEYLLGAIPTFTNRAAFIPDALKTGQGYGDYIWLKNLKSSEIDTSLSGTRIKKTAPYEATVETTISHGGVYPLWVSNGMATPFGGKAGFTALPGLLTVSPGPELWYSKDNGTPEFHAGSTELIIGPISDKLGTGLVRLVAAAPDGDQTFKAVVKPLDLSGDWAALFSNPVLTYNDCPDSEDPTDAFDLAGFLSGYGTFVLDPDVQDGSHYTWEGALPEDSGESVFVNAEIFVTPEKITLEYLVDIPKPDSNSGLPGLPGARAGGSPPFPGLTLRESPLAALRAGPKTPGLTLAFLGFLALGVFTLSARPSFRRSFSPLAPPLARGLSLLLVLLFVTTWLSGCFGFAFWGTFTGTYTFNRVEIASPQNIPADLAEQPGIKWVLSGDGVINYDLYSLVVTEDLDGNKTSKEEHCVLEYTTSLTGLVGPADMVPPPDSGGDE